MTDRRETNNSDARPTVIIVNFFSVIFSVIFIYLFIFLLVLPSCNGIGLVTLLPLESYHGGNIFKKNKKRRKDTVNPSVSNRPLAHGTVPRYVATDSVNHPQLQGSCYEN